MSQWRKVEVGVADHCACNKVDSGAVSSAAVPTFAEEGDVAFIALNRELDQHIQMGRLDAAEVGVLTLIHLQCDYRTLVWPGSAAKVSSLLRVTEKQARRILETLESKGFIKREPIPGRHGNYPILLLSKACRDMGEQWASSGPADRVGVGELRAMTNQTNEKENGSPTGIDGRASGELWASSGQLVGHSSTSTITNTRTKKDKPLVPPDPRRMEFMSYYFAMYQIKFAGVPKVPWDDVDGFQLNLLLKKNPSFDLPVLKQLFMNWWESDNINRAAKPATWLPKLPTFASGSQDIYGRPMKELRLL